MKSWNPDTIFELIELYRQRPVLWDHSHPSAKKTELKQAAWSEIATIMKRTDVEKKINILVVQFRREMKKLRELQEKHQSGDTSIPLQSKWFAFEAMYFLKDKMRKHKQLNLPANFQDVSQKSRKPRKEKISSVRPALATDRLANIETDDYDVTNIETECDPVFTYDTKDEYSAFGDLVAIKIRKLPTASYKSKAMNIITNVLFQLESEFMDGECDAETYISTEYVGNAEADDTETH